MPARARFTEERIEALPPASAGKRTTYHDTEAPALRLRVTVKGAKSYYFLHRVRNGGMEWIHLGETPRVRVLGDDELKRFWTVLQAEPNDVARDFFVVALLTKARRSNVLAIAWQDVDLKDRREHGDLHARGTTSAALVYQRLAVDPVPAAASAAADNILGRAGVMRRSQGRSGADAGGRHGL